MAKICFAPQGGPAQQAPAPRGGLTIQALLPLLFLSLWALASVGCSGFLPFRSPLPVVTGPWQIPPEELATQRLYRMTYEGAQGRLSFRLTLYLQDAQIYSMRASDPLGRKLWTLSVDAENRALWLDHREKEYCSVAGASTLQIVPLADFPLTSLPRLILGFMPVDPSTELADNGVDISFRDATGRRWSASREEGRLAWWSLAPAGEPIVWWRAKGRGGIFSDRRGQQQLTWKQVAREALAANLDPAIIPAEYAAGLCPQADVLAAGIDRPES